MEREEDFVHGLLVVLIRKQKKGIISVASDTPKKELKDNPESAKYHYNSYVLVGDIYLSLSHYANRPHYY